METHTKDKGNKTKDKRNRTKETRQKRNDGYRLQAIGNRPVKICYLAIGWLGGYGRGGGTSFARATEVEGRGEGEISQNLRNLREKDKRDKTKDKRKKMKKDINSAGNISVLCTLM